MLAHGAEPNAIAITGRTPLDELIWATHPSIDATRTARALLDAGTDWGAPRRWTGQVRGNSGAWAVLRKQPGAALQDAVGLVHRGLAMILVEHPNCPLDAAEAALMRVREEERDRHVPHRPRQALLEDCESVLTQRRTANIQAGQLATVLVSPGERGPTKRL